ncbi:MAG: hypothetical protein PHW52_01825 [Candidatus Pacebacteria bacterium]|nr:hypothetical protein [Candidatus Paceibacterota bacterium]
MKVFTVETGKVEKGVSVEPFELKNAKMVIPAVIVGEIGRGRGQGVLTIQMSPELLKAWEMDRKMKIFAAQIGKTRNGGNKLIATVDRGSEERAIFVLRTSIGYRGGNVHTGDELVEGGGYEAFPGEILTSGVIAQGDAGRMGSGDQIVAIIPRNVVFRTAYTGRLYGEPSEHYYKWVGGDNVLAISGTEREIADIF